MDSTGAGSGASVFARSMATQGLEIGCAGIGGIAFLGMGVLGIAGVLGPDIGTRLIGGGMFGFFGLFMLVSAASALGRGSDPRVAEISAAGAWLPEMGFLRWDQLDEVRLERIRGVGGTDEATTKQFRRLGFVPVDRSLRPARTTGAAWGMAALYFRLVKSIAPEMRLGGDQPAPFGVSETDIKQDFDRLVAAVGRYVTMGDAAESRARERAARWATPPATEPSTTPDLAALDAALGTVTQPVGPSASPAALVVALPGPGRPAATFNVPAVKPVEAIFALMPILAPLTVLLAVGQPVIRAGGPQGMVMIGVIGFIVVSFALPSVVASVRLVRRARDRREDPARLRVGPDGIWTRAGGLVPWDAVRSIRTERAGRTRQLGRPSVERWRIVVEPSSAGAAHGAADSDELDAPFDDVLDLVRVYHPVVETS